MCLCSSSIVEEGPRSHFYLPNVHPRKEVTLFPFRPLLLEGRRRPGFPAQSSCSAGWAASSGPPSVAFLLPPTFVTRQLFSRRRCAPLLKSSSCPRLSRLSLNTSSPSFLLSPPPTPGSFELRRSLNCRAAAAEPSFKFFGAIIQPVGWLCACRPVPGIYSPSAPLPCSAPSRKRLGSKNRLNGGRLEKGEDVKAMRLKCGYKLHCSVGGVGWGGQI